MIIQGRYLYGRLPATLCWYCKNAVNGCCWSRHFKPVEGWKAIPTTIYEKNEPEGMESYLVLDCPAFEADIEEEQLNKRKRQRLIDKHLYEQKAPDEQKTESGTACGH